MEEFLRANLSISPIIGSVVALMFGPATKWESLARVPHSPGTPQGTEMVIGQWCPPEPVQKKNTNPSGEKTSKMPVDKDQSNIGLQSFIDTQGNRISRTQNT